MAGGVVHRPAVSSAQGWSPKCVIDTLAGAVIGVVVLVLLSSVTDRAKLQRHHAQRTARLR